MSLIYRQRRFSYYTESAFFKNYAMSDRGYSEIFGVNSYIREVGIMIILIISCVLLASGYYLEEKQSGVLCILRCSDYGVKKIYSAKIRIITVVTLVLTMILVAVDMLILKKMYGFHYMSAPLISLTFMENKIPLVFMDIKIWQYMILDVLTKLSVVLCTLFVTLLFSLKTRSLFFVPLLMLVMAVTGTISIFAGVVVKLGIIAVMFMLSVGCIIRIYRISV